MQDRVTLFALAVRLFLGSTGVAADIARQALPFSSGARDGPTGGNRLRCVLALWLASHGKSPYSGWPYHEPPLMLALLQYSCESDVWCIVPFVMADVVAAWTLCHIQNQIPSSPEDSDGGRCTVRLSAVYLLNPLTVLSCVGSSTRSFENCLILICICAAMHRQVSLAAFSLCCAMYVGLYPVLFLMPLSMFVVQRGEKGRIDLLIFLFSFSVFTWLLCLLSHLYLIQFKEHEGHSILPSIADLSAWMNAESNPIRSDVHHWMLSSYGFIFKAQDLTPNMGLWWYFFTEMFPFYRPFFRFVFHCMSCIFSVPFCISFPESPLFILLLQILTLSIFRPYPTVADYALIIEMLLLFPAILERVGWWWFLVVTGAVLSVLEPVMWHEWVQTESANANFYFSINLLIALWQILLMALLIVAMIKAKHKAKQD